MALVTLAAAPVSAGQFFKESFESAPGGSYTLSNPFDDGLFSYFNRYSVPVPPGGIGGDLNRDDFTSGWDGSYGIFGEDHDGTGGAATRLVTVPDINISGRSGLSVKIALGAFDTVAYEPGDGDGIKIYATIGGGTRQLIGEFAPPAAGDGLFLDTDGDGVGDGVGLTTSLASHTFTVPGSGSTLTLEIEMTSTDLSETLAVDNVRVSSSSDTWTPYYDLASFFYNLYSAYGYPYYAAALYYYYYGMGDYYFHIAGGNTASALYAYYNGFGLYYFYVYVSLGNYKAAYYTYYAYLAMAFYYYYAELGDSNTALIYYYALIAYALYFA